MKTLAQIEPRTPISSLPFTISISVDSGGNLIVRNSATGNTSNYEIVANNKVSVIVAAPNSVAISGSTGGAGVGPLIRGRTFRTNRRKQS